MSLFKLKSYPNWVSSCHKAGFYRKPHWSPVYRCTKCQKICDIEKASSAKKPIKKIKRITTFEQCEKVLNLRRFTVTDYAALYRITKHVAQQRLNRLYLKGIINKEKKVIKKVRYKEDPKAEITYIEYSIDKRVLKHHMSDT